MIITIITNNYNDSNNENSKITIMCRCLSGKMISTMDQEWLMLEFD